MGFPAFPHRWPRLSLTGSRAKVFVPAAAAAVAMCFLSAWRFDRSERRVATVQFASAGELAARAFAENARLALAARDYSLLARLPRGALEVPGVAYAYVTGEKGSVLAHSFPSDFPEPLLNRKEEPAPGSSASRASVAFGGQRFLDLAVPVPLPGGGRGSAHLGFEGEGPLSGARRQARDVFLFSFLATVLIFLSILELVRRSMRKVLRLSVLSREVAEGEALKPSEAALLLEAGADADEISVLIQNFFKMIGEIRHQRANLEQLVELRTSSLKRSNDALLREVEERRRVEEALRLESLSIELLQKASVVANAASSSEVALKTILRLVADFYGFSYAQAVVPAESASGARFAGLSFKSRDFDPIRLRELAGKAGGADGWLAGKVLQDRSPHWMPLPGSAMEGEEPRLQAASALGFRGAAAYPVLIGLKVEVVLEFFSEKPFVPTEQNLLVMRNVGIQLGHVLEREESARRIEQQQANVLASAKMSSVGEMAGGIAHEINSPLATIKTISGQLEELLAEGCPDLELLTQKIAKITKTADRIGRIVMGLRTISRDSSNDPFAPVAVRDLIDDATSLCGERFHNHGTRLILDPAPEGLALEARRIELAQALLNLLGNAFDATAQLEDRWVQVTVQDLGAQVEIRVADSGAAIPGKVKEKLFQPFFTTKEIGKGTGMGLSISLGIAKRHGGDLFLDGSCPHTCFVIRLPKSQARSVPAGRKDAA